MTLIHDNKKYNKIERFKLSQPADINRILSEVKKHGFYSVFCINLMPDIVNHDALITEIRHMAAHSELRVTFNAEESICIFEND